MSADDHLPAVAPAAAKSHANALLERLLAARNRAAEVRTALDRAMVAVRGGKPEAPALEPKAVQSITGFFPAADVLASDLETAIAAIAKQVAELGGKF